MKRMRPADLWPYDYSREIETPLLWVSEGFTSYYNALTRYRAGFRDARTFLGDVARPIAEVEGVGELVAVGSSSLCQLWIARAPAAQGRELVAQHEQLHRR